MSEVNETRFLAQHDFREFKYRVIQKLNHDESRCECKKIDSWSSCKDGYMWNPSTCDCECNKACKLVNIQILKIFHVKNVYLMN